MVVCDQILSPASIPFKELRACFASSRSIFGCSFTSQGQDLIYEGGQSSYRFFSFSTPFSEDQIVEYLNILSNEGGEKKRINVQFIHQLLEAYESQKPNLITFNEEEEEEEENGEKEKEDVRF